MGGSKKKRVPVGLKRSKKKKSTPEGPQSDKGQGREKELKAHATQQKKTARGREGRRLANE